MPPATPKACPCGSNLLFAACCEPVIAQHAAAKTALQLMRSRYSAFALGEARHILASHQASANDISDTRIQQLRAELGSQHWLALRIIDTRQGREQDLTGIVEFCAFYREHNGSIGQLHERSRFHRNDGRWFYVDGDLLPPLALGRNDPCWCGSHRKYKKCHLNAT